LEISILSNKEEKLFDRHSIVFSMEYDSRTPSKDEAKAELCRKVNLRPDFTVITSIEQEFGSRQCTARAHSYSSRESMERYETKHLLGRLAKKEAKASGEQAEKKEPEAKAEKAEKKEAKERKPKEDKG
jgi:ribosomal protein S24E